MKEQHKAYTKETPIHERQLMDGQGYMSHADTSTLDTTTMECQGRHDDTVRIVADRETMLAAALAYADMGWPVFPLMPYTKRPASPNGFRDATTDKQQIREWWADKPRNIGIATGQQGGLLLLDPDTYKGVEDDPAWGDAIFERSARGGLHRWYRYPPGCGLTIGENKPRQGVDFRGEGGYAMVAPSVLSWQTTTPDGSTINHWGQAAWIDDPFTKALPYPPMSLLDALRGVCPEKLSASPALLPRADGPAGNPNGGYWLEWALGKVKPGERSHWCAQMAYQLRDNGIPLDEAVAIGAEYAEAVTTLGDHPYEAKDAEGTIRSAYRTTPRQPSTPRIAAKGEPTHESPAFGRCMELLTERTIGFRLPGGEPWITLPMNEGYQHTRAVSEAVRQWLRYEYFREEGRNITSHVLEDVVKTNAARIAREGEVRPAYLRLAPLPDGSLWLDLDGINAVHITPEGWEVQPVPKEIAFHRPLGYLPLPEPLPGGKLDDLRRFLNCGEGEQGERNWRLMLAWVLSTYNPRADQAILVLNGEAGSGKTTTSTILRALVDPNTADTSIQPKTEDDILFQGTRSWIVGYDNLRSLPHWMSDALCRVSTGMAHSRRRLYTDDDPVLWSFRRPVVINGINRLVVQPDLAQRALVIELPALVDEESRTWSKEELLCDLREAMPKILGALLDAVVCAIRRLPEVRKAIKGRFRLGDFHLWITAAEPALGWSEGTMTTIMRGQREEARQALLESQPVLLTLLDYLDDYPNNCMLDQHQAIRVKLEGGNRVLRGSARQVLQTLSLFARWGQGIDIRNPKLDWPQQERVFARQLRDARSALERCGVVVKEQHLHGRTVFNITLTRPPERSGGGDIGRISTSMLPRQDGLNSGEGGIGVIGGQPTSLLGEEEEDQEEERRA